MNGLLVWRSGNSVQETIFILWHLWNLSHLWDLCETLVSSLQSHLWNLYLRLCSYYSHSCGICHICGTSTSHCPHFCDTRGIYHFVKTCTSRCILTSVMFVEPVHKLRLVLTSITSANVYHGEGAVKDSVRFQNVIQLIKICFIPVSIQDISFMSCHMYWRSLFKELRLLVSSWSSDCDQVITGFVFVSVFGVWIPGH